MTSTNPFILAIAKYDQQLYPEFSNSFWKQYKTLLILYSFGLLFGIIGLGGKLWRKDLWWLRLSRSSQGFRIQQNTAVAFLIFKTIFCLLAIVSIYEQFKTYRYHGDQYNIQIWRTAIWIPLLFGGIVEAFGIISASSVTRSAQKLITIQPNSKSGLQTRRSTILPNYISNVASIIYPTLSLFAILVPLLLANYWYNKTTSLYFDQIRPLLVEASISTQPTKILAEILPLQGLAERYNSNSAYWIKVAFGIFVSLAFITFIIFVIGAVTLYRILISQRKILLRSASTLRLLSSQQQEEDTYKDPSSELSRRLSTSAITVANSRAKEARVMEEKASELEGARRLLVAQSIVFLICIVGYGIDCIAICIDPLREAVDPGYYSVIALSSYWLYAILGIPAMFLVTLSTLRTKSGNFIGSPTTARVNNHNRTNVLDLSINQRSSVSTFDVGSKGGDRNEEEGEGFEDEELEVSAYELRKLGIRVNPNSASTNNNNGGMGMRRNDSLSDHQTRTSNPSQSRTSESTDFNNNNVGTEKYQVSSAGRSFTPLVSNSHPSRSGNGSGGGDSDGRNSISRDEFFDIPMGTTGGVGVGWKPSAWARSKDQMN